MRMPTILRKLLPLLLALALLAPGAAHAQRHTFLGVPWGLPADSVRARVEARGWTFMSTNEHGDPRFRSPDRTANAQTVFGGGKLVMVRVAQGAVAADLESGFRAAVDSLSTRFGAPTDTLEGGQFILWGRVLTTLAMRAVPARDSVPAMIVVVFIGPGAQEEEDRRAGKPYPALPEGWVQVGTGSDRRMAVDTASVVAVEPGVFRARVRYDLLEPRTDSGKRFDAADWDADYDCTRRRVRMRDFVQYFQGRQVNDLGDLDRWMAARANTTQSKELDLVCRLAAELLPG